ncbi:hypothetical protein ACJMK2_004973 [Sinanodonta woodiana]|uniref:Uncharacterized protein n=1 Tax=Sinanodonta woodiana TaxID=1069815 RepID=A0ABD3VNN3_SINWO
MKLFCSFQFYLCGHSCDCICSHVAAVHFKVEIGVRLGMTQISSTFDGFQGLVGSRSKPVDSVIPNGNNQLSSMDTLKSLKGCMFMSCCFFPSIPPLNGELESESVVETKQSFPPLLNLFTDDTPASLPTEVNLKIFDKIWNTYSCSDEQVEHVTRSHLVSHGVLVRRADTFSDILVKSIMGYSTSVESQLIEFEARLTWLLISTKYLFLGDSNDRLLKCKYLSDAVQCDTGFSFREDLTLKATHRSYTQVQLQMHVHQEHCITRVNYDTLFSQKLAKSYREYLLCN